MLRGKAFVLSAAAIALAGAGAGVLLATHGGSSRAVSTTGDMPGKASQASGKKTYAQLVAANYKILNPQQSARLLRYADATFICMSQGLELGNPQTSPTKIVMIRRPERSRSRSFAAWAGAQRGSAIHRPARLSSCADRP